MKNRAKFIFVFILLISLLQIVQVPYAHTDEITIIVNASNPISQLTPDEVTDYFLKRKRQWPDKTSVRFIDRIDNSPEKNAFLKQILNKTSREVDLFWIGQKLYTGDSAPIQVTTDSMTATLVSRFKGAISYVSGSFTDAIGVRKITVLRDR